MLFFADENPTIYGNDFENGRHKIQKIKTKNLQTTEIWIFKVATGGLFNFSDILKISNLNPKIKKGCIVDTSILFAMSYPNDSFNTAASLEQLIKRIFSERYNLQD